MKKLWSRSNIFSNVSFRNFEVVIQFPFSFLGNSLIRTNRYSEHTFPQLIRIIEVILYTYSRSAHFSQCTHTKSHVCAAHNCLNWTLNGFCPYLGRINFRCGKAAVRADTCWQHSLGGGSTLPVYVSWPRSHAKAADEDNLTEGLLNSREPAVAHLDTYREICPGKVVTQPENFWLLW